MLEEDACIRAPAEAEGGMGNGNRARAEGKVTEEEEGSIAQVADEAVGRGKGIVAVNIMDVHPGEVMGDIMGKVTGKVMGKVEVTRKVVGGQEWVRGAD